MPSVPRSALLREFRTLFESGTVAGLTDGQLLERFLERRDEAGEIAFAALVARHGPMVLGVCRRALADPNDAADAFQATFLVLVRKARSIRVDDSLGRWLYGVSRKVAGRARSDVARRPRSLSTDCEANAQATDPDRFELWTLLDEELAKLPEAYRSAVVLCDLGGLTHEEAARDLVCPVGTIKSRLARGRRQLRERLERRGLAPSILMLAPPIVPASLAQAAVKSSNLAMVAMKSAVGVVPASAVVLAEGVLKSMSGIHLHLAVGSMLLVGVVSVGGVVLGPSQQEDPKPAANVQSGAIAQDSPAKTVVEPGLTGRPAELARQAFPADHWINAPGVQCGYYDTNQGVYVYAKDFRVVIGSKNLGVQPFALIRVDKDGKIEGTIASRDAAIDFSQPLGQVLPQGGVLWIDHLSLHGDVRSRSEVGEIRSESLELDLPRKVAEPPSAVASPEPLVQRGRKTLPKGGLTTDPPRELSKVSMPEYVVGPPDIILVEVLEALKGRPITGEHLVKPDGKINLGFYGEVHVAGLTTTEIKEKVALHLRQYLKDETLGLSRQNPETGQFEKVEPRRSDRIFIDVVAYNSQVYYVQGDVGVPGRLPITGNETVLDAINFAGGLIPSASKTNIQLVRPIAPGTPGEMILPIDLEAIINRGDTRTNYQILPGDRLVVARRDLGAARTSENTVTTGPIPEPAPNVEARLQTVERKLDEVLKALEKLSKP